MNVTTEEKVMIWCIASFILIVIAICMVLWHMDNARSVKAEARQAERVSAYHKHNFTAKELSGVVNMKPLYIVE